MSQVRVRDRQLSKIQYIDTARELLKHTISYAKKFPKSVMFFITKDLVDIARNVYKEVVIANSCYPKQSGDIEFRRVHLLNAKGDLDALDGLLSISLELYQGDLLESKKTVIKADGTQKEVKQGISDYGWNQWGELIDKEKNLISRVLTADAKITF